MQEINLKLAEKWLRLKIRKLENKILKAQQFIKDLQESKADLIITETEVFLFQFLLEKLQLTVKLFTAFQIQLQLLNSY